MVNMKNDIRNICRHYRETYEIFLFDRYRKKYDTFPFSYKKKIAQKWLGRYPKQAHFDFPRIKYWLESVVKRPVAVLEIGGWRGDLADIALRGYEHIRLWHNYDLINSGNLQKCFDERYQLITLDDEIWHSELKSDYNALIASHMIEHINWREFKELAGWIPPGIDTVLFEAPLPQSGESINWKGDYSSHVLEKGWEQVKSEMKNNGFRVESSEKNTVIFTR